MLHSSYSKMPKSKSLRETPQELYQRGLVAMNQTIQAHHLGSAREASFRRLAKAYLKALTSLSKNLRLR